MLERDLNRMEEANLDDVHDGENQSEDGDITIQEGGQKETGNPVEQLLPKVKEASIALENATTNDKLSEQLKEIQQLPKQAAPDCAQCQSCKERQLRKLLRKEKRARKEREQLELALKMAKAGN